MRELDRRAGGAAKCGERGKWGNAGGGIKGTLLGGGCCVGSDRCGLDEVWRRRSRKEKCSGRGKERAKTNVREVL